jgi:hypothetical protein
MLRKSSPRGRPHDKVFTLSLLLYSVSALLNHDFASPSSHQPRLGKFDSSRTAARPFLAIRSRITVHTEESGDEDLSLRDVVVDRLTSLKDELFAMADQTNRGFHASAQEKSQMKDMVYELARFNPSKYPAREYYERSISIPIGGNGHEGYAISGKWTLIYTDAPDITGLDTSRNPLATAKLGRIGQECSPPYIKNVIEWLRPTWAINLPFSGTDTSRILQKVVTSASAIPSKPLLVELKVAGLELAAGDSSTSTTTMSSTFTDFLQRIQDQGIPEAILSLQPIDLKGPFNPPFGYFEILYLDEDLRLIRTSQNYLAANRRIQQKNDEWF